MRIRCEEPPDLAAIGAVTAAAFRDVAYATHTEHLIVDALRREGDLSLSLVADEGGRIVGHVAASPVALSDGTPGWYGLGPVSVLPERQGMGIGTRLVERALAELRGKGAGGCVVLGDPLFYRRFGFRAEPALRLPDVPPEYFLGLAFQGPVPAATVAYASAFQALGG